MIKNPNWKGAKQAVILKCGQGFKLGTKKNKSSERSGRDK